MNHRKPPTEQDDEWSLTQPGDRSGEGSASIVPYLIDSLSTKPKDLTLPLGTPAPAKVQNRRKPLS
jgi:hypothetical protein